MQIRIESRENIIDLLAENACYPFMSSKGKIFFRPAGKVPNPSDIVEGLNISSGEECAAIRRIVSERCSRMRVNLPIHAWVSEERPREMLLEKGPEHLSLAKLLAIILRTGKEGASAEELAMRLLNSFDGLRGIDAAPVSDICKIGGIGPAKAAQVKASLELGKRLSRAKAEKALTRIRKIEDVIKYVGEFYGPYLRDARQETFNIILLDIKNKPLKRLELSRGSVSASIVDPRDIIREASLVSASGVILVHNHPSGETQPSAEDVKITGQITGACKLVGIKVLDHIIVGRDMEDYFSFAAERLL